MRTAHSCAIVTLFDAASFHGAESYAGLVARLGPARAGPACQGAVTVGFA